MFFCEAVTSASISRANRSRSSIVGLFFPAIQRYQDDSATPAVLSHPARESVVDWRRMESSFFNSFMFSSFTRGEHFCKPLPRMTIIQGLPAKTYHADHTRISKHGLDLIRRAPALLEHSRRAGYRPPTPTQLLGTLVHLAVLEPERFGSVVALKPKATKTSAAGREEWAALEQQFEHIVDQETLDQVSAMAASVRAAAGSLLEGSINEATIHWAAYGAACKCRPDAIKDDCIVDVKTAADASPEAFQRDAIRFRYHVQAAFYLDALRSCCEPAESFAFVVVEKTAPYLATVFVPDEAFIEAGRREYKEDLDTYRECIASEVWPGYAREHVLTLPTWYR